jgi:hypothetical protein
MSEENTQTSDEALGKLAREVLIDLYHALCGHYPKAVRVYGEGDALLLLLRFDPDELAVRVQSFSEAPADATFAALPDMIASAVARRHGQALEPGDLRICTERGLAVFAFRALEDEPAGRRDGSELFASLRPSLSPAAAAYR